MEGGKIKKAPKPFGLRALTLSMFQLSAVRTGLEPATPCVTGMYSNQAELPHHSVVSLLSLSIAVAKVDLFSEMAIASEDFF